MRKPDELEIIKTFQNSFGLGRGFVPEDVETLYMDGRNFFVKADMLVQSTDVPKGMKLSQIARKSIVSCVSDFACKGIRPRYAIISLALPSGITRKVVNELAKGFKKASKEFGVKIVGGDVNKGKEIIIDVSMFGTGGRIVRRKGAEKGDIIVTTGPFGYTTAGLRIILQNFNASRGFAEKCKKRLFLPTPHLDFGLQAAKYFTSSMDSSDGLSATLNDMSKLSKRRFVITRIPMENEVLNFAVKNAVSVTKLVFCGGEEYEIVATVPKGSLGRVIGIAKRLGIPLYEIGYVTAGKNVVWGDGRKRGIINRCGWVHFRS